MSLYIDKKFVSFLAPKLDRFVQKNKNVWNFRCPICNDSKKNKIKARGFIFTKKSNLCFICHNCGASMSFGNFLKRMDTSLYEQYRMERYKNESHTNVPRPEFESVSSRPVFTKRIDLPSIAELSDTHTAKKYIMSRKIPVSYWSSLYYADDFLKFADTIFPEHGKKLIREEPRIIIPFYDQNKVLHGFQGRAIGTSKIRYITLKAHDDSLKIYGLDKLDLRQTIHVLEGPFDSMFIKNSVATMDANLSSVVNTLGKDHDYVLVFDNQPRNADVCKQINRAIEKGFKVCIFPPDVSEKDINEMILAGRTPENIANMIQDNTWVDLKAKLQFSLWRKT